MITPLLGILTNGDTADVMEEQSAYFKNSQEAYISVQEHILDELRLLNRLLTSYVLRMRKNNFYKELKDFKGFFISEEEIDALLTAQVFESDGMSSNKVIDEAITKLQIQVSNIRKNIRARILNTLQKGNSLPLLSLGKIFNLTEFEYQTLIICLAPDIDYRYQKLFGYLQDDINKTYPSIGLILNILNPLPEVRLKVWHYFSPHTALFKHNLIENNDEGYGKNMPHLSKQLKIDERIIGYILGDNNIESQLDSIVSVWDSQHEGNQLLIPTSIRDRLVHLIKKHKKADNENLKRMVFVLSGAVGMGKLSLARTIAKTMELPLLEIDLRAILSSGISHASILKRILRESYLIPALLYFNNAETLSNEELISSCEVFYRIISQYPDLFILGSCSPLEIQKQFPDRQCLDIEISTLDFSKRCQIWQYYLNNPDLNVKDININDLAGKFKFTPRQIRAAVNVAISKALWGSSPNLQLTMDDLYEGCRSQSNQKLKFLAQKVRPQYRWEDIVLPEDHMKQLSEIVSHIKYQNIVFNDWGFDKKFSLGKGLSVLFSGPSGTGKTMAAEIIAHTIKLDLYKIDLSTVVSKYIGETEKNLAKIFGEAETSNAILFFDEADAILGKRTEVKDAHDRYANIETSYLLQRMEEYEGIVILATNLRSNIDQAYIRRINYIIDFPFPDELHRARIWQKVFPAEMPVKGKLDFEFLAKQFKITGGNIKNIALKAAYYAAEDGNGVKMKHLVRAIKRELQKIGKLYSNTDFGTYSKLT